MMRTSRHSRAEQPPQLPLFSAKLRLISLPKNDLWKRGDDPVDEVMGLYESYCERQNRHLTVSVKLVEFNKVPEVPVTVSVYVPAGVPRVEPELDPPPPHEQIQTAAVNRTMAADPTRPSQAILRLAAS
jgi:hypothetical protein